MVSNNKEETSKFPLYSDSIFELCKREKIYKFLRSFSFSLLLVIAGFVCGEKKSGVAVSMHTAIGSNVKRLWVCNTLENITIIFPSYQHKMEK